MTFKLVTRGPVKASAAAPDSVLPVTAPAFQNRSGPARDTVKQRVMAGG
jgi:hypothetical protein